MTRDQLLAQIRMITLIEDVNVTDAQIVTLIDQGMLEVGLAHPWPFLEESTTLGLTADTQTYAVPAGVDIVVAVVDDDHNRRIEYIAPATFFQRYGNDNDNTSTYPEFYTIWDDAIYVTPTPSATDANRLTLYYYETITPLANGSAVPEFNAAFHYILVEYCKWKLYDREEYFDQSERAFIMFNRYLDQMITFYTRRVQQAPYIAGDGTYNRSAGDPNLRWMWTV